MVEKDKETQSNIKDTSKVRFHKLNMLKLIIQEVIVRREYNIANTLNKNERIKNTKNNKWIINTLTK